MAYGDKPEIVNSYTSAVDPAATSGTITLPTSVAQLGDLLVLYTSMASANQAAMPTDDSGGTWRRVKQSVYTAAADMFVRPVTPSDLDGTVATFSESTGASIYMSAVLVVIRGTYVDDYSPHTFSDTANSAAFNLDLRTIETGRPNALLLAHFVGAHVTGVVSVEPELTVVQSVMAGPDASGARLVVIRADPDTSQPGTFSGYTVSFQASRSWTFNTQSFIPARHQTVRPTARSTDVQTFTASGTWLKPDGAREVNVICIGGGGAGGSGRRGAAGTVRNSGGAGSGGGYSQAVFSPDALASSVAVVIGAGGVGGAAVTADDTNGNAGSGGSASSFGSYLTAVGGNPGAGGTLSGTPSGGAATTGPQTDPGGAGAAGPTSGGNGNTPTAISTSRGPTGGGSGRGLNASNTGGTGASGGTHNLYGATAGGAAGGGTGSTGLPGSTGPSVGFVGLGGGGGGSVSGGSPGPGGDGGSGGLYGGGGGSGSPSTNGYVSGAGGNGGPGVVIVTTFF